jgi:hypothetical protein
MLPFQKWKRMWWLLPQIAAHPQSVHPENLETCDRMRLTGKLNPVVRVVQFGGAVLPARHALCPACHPGVLLPQSQLLAPSDCRGQLRSISRRSRADSQVATQRRQKSSAKAQHPCLTKLQASATRSERKRGNYIAVAIHQCCGALYRQLI